MDKEEKKRQILELTNEQYKYIKKTLAVAKLPPGKRPSTRLRRIGKIFAYAMKVRALQMQKQIIASQPVFDGFTKGGVAIEGEGGNELIINKDVIL